MIDSPAIRYVCMLINEKNLRVYILFHICIYIHTYIYTNMNMYKYIFIRIDQYIHIYAYIYVYREASFTCLAQSKRHLFAGTTASTVSMNICLYICIYAYTYNNISTNKYGYNWIDMCMNTYIKKIHIGTKTYV
jgi:hypothetical protein